MLNTMTQPNQYTKGGGKGKSRAAPKSRRSPAAAKKFTVGKGTMGK